MNIVYLRMEIIRLLRNRRVLIFSILMPALLLLIFGGLYGKDALNGVKAASYLMVNMGLFGSMSAAIGSGGSIALERGIGWNRQLRLTGLASGDSPLTPREADVLRAARMGGTVADIAVALTLSEGTVRNHLSSAIGKTGARTRGRSGTPRR